MSKYNIVSVMGATASGKTSFAAKLAVILNGEIISADSRQVYRGMDIGTGKDLEDYNVDGKNIRAHLVDIVDAGYQYNVFEYQQDFLKIFEDMKIRGVFPVLCGGSGMYIEAVLKNYKLIQVPDNPALRESIKEKDLSELATILESYKSNLHNISDISTAKRAVRAIEIADYCSKNPELETKMPPICSLNIGIKFDRLSRRKRITERLHQRLKEGMLEEVKKLLDSGIKPENLIYYGLEYKFLTQHLIGQLSYDEMVSKLNVAIHQFAKRQMTWFRKMEKQGTVIHWLDGYMPMDEKIEKTLGLLNHH